MGWTVEMIEELKKLWAQGITTGEIGKKLGVSKNSIVGKVHRLGLSGRPSPIKKKDDGKENETKPTSAPKNKTEKTTAKPAPKEKTTVPPVETPQSEERAPNPTSQVSQARPAPAPTHFKEGKASLTDLDNHTCRWPIGDPKDENFHFCGRKVKIGQTYCEEHASLAYVKAIKK